MYRRESGRRLLKTTLSGDPGGNSTGVNTVIRSWKHHSTDGILGVSRGQVFSSGTVKQGVGRAVAMGELKTNRMHLT